MIIYTVPNCPKCALLKKRAGELGIEYTESQDNNEVINAGFRSAPVLKYLDRFYSYKDALELLKHLGAENGNNT